MKTIVKGSIAAVALGGMLASGIFIGAAFARQPHMANALDALRTAKSELEMAEANKGGHRERAIEYVNSAIEEVHAGMEYAD